MINRESSIGRAREILNEELDEVKMMIKVVKAHKVDEMRKK